jgi:peptidoglycan/LPS O-acetylase OafA/YrhL
MVVAAALALLLDQPRSGTEPWALIFALLALALLAAAYFNRSRYRAFVVAALLAAACSFLAGWFVVYLGNTAIYVSAGIWFVFLTAAVTALWVGRPNARPRTDGIPGVVVAGAVAWSLAARLVTLALVVIAVGAYLWGGSDDARQRCAAHRFGADDSVVASVACLVAR